jgi:4-hydroxy-3-methylbut-2-en-1-yl diphosphate reductase
MSTSDGAGAAPALLPEITVEMTGPVAPDRQLTLVAPRPEETAGLGMVLAAAGFDLRVEQDGGPALRIVLPRSADPSSVALVHDAVWRWRGLVHPRRALLAAPRSFCAGVERAIQAVDDQLTRTGRPVYVRRPIVHNLHVMKDLESRGAIFVRELDEVPDGSDVVFSAHGVAPSVVLEAQRRDFSVVDATCPLVSKVHAEARRFARRGDTILFIGRVGHEEAEATYGMAPDRVRIVEDEQDAATVEVPDPQRVSYLTQTTLGVDETAAVVGVLRGRFPALQGPPSDDICYATTNRQEAARAVARESDLVLVLGSTISSNSRKLVDVSRSEGVPAWLIEDSTALRPEWLEGARTVGITAGASAPPRLVDEVIDALRRFGPVRVDVSTVTTETVQFGPPKQDAVRGLDPRRISGAGHDTAPSGQGPCRGR